MNLPSIADCHALWERYHTPRHIRRHMQQVAWVGVSLATHLQRRGISVMIECVERAALLHDLIRVTDWPNFSFDQFDKPITPSDRKIWQAQRRHYPPSIPHAQVTAGVLRHQYPELADVIAVHSVQSVFQLVSWEQKLVSYADRRVAHLIAKLPASLDRHEL